MVLTKATKAYIDVVMKIMADGRNTQRRQGFRQWEDGYPSAETISNDIEQGFGHMLIKDSEVMAYVAISYFDEEYERLGEIWQGNGEYAVLHRMAVRETFQRQGIADAVLNLAEKEAARSGASFVRADTGTENKAMQHLLTKRGYKNLGAQSFIWGPRLAYEKSVY